MASIKDVPGVMKKMGVGGFAKKVWSEVTDDDVFTWGSALAYAWIFAIFPFLVFVITLTPYLPGKAKESVMEQIATVAYSSVGGDAGDAIVKNIADVMTNQRSGLLSIGLLVALWGASGGMSMTMSALDKAYYVSCSRSFLKQRAVAIGLTIVSAALILTVVILLPVGTKVLEYLTSHGHIQTLGKILINIVRYAIALALLVAIVSVIYYYGPCINQKWQAITPGALFTVVVWVVLGFAFSFYVSKFGNFNKTYGTLGAAIILLLFFYINAVVLLIGAEVNSAIDFATLDVKPGVTDLVEAAKKAEAKGSPGGTATAPPVRLVRVPSGKPLVAKSTVAWGASVLALAWIWKKRAAGVRLVGSAVRRIAT